MRGESTCAIAAAVPPMRKRRYVANEFSVPVICCTSAISSPMAAANSFGPCTPTIGSRVSRTPSRVMIQPSPSLGTRLGYT